MLADGDAGDGYLVAYGLADLLVLVVKTEILEKVGRVADEQVLVVVRGRDGEVGRRQPLGGDVDVARPVIVGAVLQVLAGQGLVVDVPAVGQELAGDANAQLVRHQRQVHHQLLVLVDAAVDGAGQVRRNRAADGREVGLVRQEADGAAFGAGAVERALRAAEHLDAVEVKKAWLRHALVAVLGDDRHVVQVDADRRVADGGTHAADRDVVLSGAVMRRERNPGQDARDVLIVLDVVRRQFLAADHADAGGDLPGVLAAAVGRDRDLLDLLRLLGQPAGFGGRARGKRVRAKIGRAGDGVAGTGPGRRGTLRAGVAACQQRACDQDAQRGARQAVLTLHWIRPQPPEPAPQPAATTD